MSASTRKICDPHFHVWSPSTHSWLKNKENLIHHPAGDMRPVGNDYTYDMFQQEPDGDKYEMVGCVYLQCFHDDPLKEMVEIKEASSKAKYTDINKIPCSIVGYAQLQDDNIKSIIDKYCNTIGASFMGIRQCLDWHPKYENRRLAENDELMMNPKFHKGLRYLLSKNKIFDLQLYPSQMKTASVLVASLANGDSKNGKIVINHCGFALKEDFDNGIWHNGIKLLSQASDNVFIKLSGWGIFLNNFKIEDDKYDDYIVGIIKHCIKCFGIDRCMFASDFPVDKIHGNYNNFWDKYVKILKTKLNLSEKDIDKVICQNAMNIYGLSQLKAKL